MTTKERVESLHARIDALRRMRERRKTGLTGAACAVLALCLVWLIFVGGTAHAGGSAGLYSGATILFENAGGYVLAAIIAFMTGVVITAVILKKKNKEKEQINSEKTHLNHDKEENHDEKDR